MKHRMIKRWTALFLALLMIVTCLPQTVLADGTEDASIQIQEAESTLEDSTKQLGEYTPAAESFDAEEAAKKTETEPSESEESAENEVPAMETIDIGRKYLDANEAPEPTAPYDGRAYEGQITLSGTKIVNGKTESVNYILLGTR